MNEVVFLLENKTVMAETVLKESKHIEWRIQNFWNQPTEDDYKIESAYFSDFGAKWFLRIYTNGRKSYNTIGFIGPYLMRNESAVDHRVNFRIGIKKTDGSEFKAVVYEQDFFKNTETRGYGTDLLIERSKLFSSKKDVAPDGTLTIFCNIKIMYRPLASSAVEIGTQTHCDDEPTIIGDLKNLYLGSHHADLTITVKGKEFRAHRSILSSRSAVFESMFLHDTVEKNSGVVEITDCDPDTFQDFLLFLYTGKYDNMSSSNVVSLYKSADKYDVKELKEKCVRCMIDELANDVFCDFLYLAKMQDEQELLKAVTDYFIKNARTIVTTPKWQTFLGEHPVLGNELFFKQLVSKDNINK